MTRDGIKATKSTITQHLHQWYHTAHNNNNYNNNNDNNVHISVRPETEKPTHVSHTTAECSGVARICCKAGQSWKLGHGALTVDFRAGCSSCSMTNSFVTNVVLIECVLLTSA